MAEMLRLFVALELPAAVLAGLEASQDRLRRAARGQARGPDQAVRWVRPEGIHLTLKFLGDAPAGQVADLGRALEAAADGHGPLALHTAGLGCFPNPTRPRVIWTGLAGDLDGLGRLQAAVEQALHPLGFPPEERPFSPHLTLGRIRQEASAADARALGALVSAADPGPEVAWTALALSLMRSELDRAGARYTCLAEVPLPARP